MNIHCSKSLDYTLALCLPLLMCKPANDRVIKNERAGNIFGGNQTFNGCAHLDLVLMNSRVFTPEDYSKLLSFSVIQLPVTE